MTQDSAGERKIFVPDTNIFIHDPEAIFKFADNEVVIPMTVIEELDKLKKGDNEIARNARQAIRNLLSLRTRGNLNNGVTTDDGGLVRIEPNHVELLGDIAKKLDMKVPDNRIVAVAYNLMQSQSDRKVIFVTKDGAPCLKADALLVPVEDYENDKVRIDDFHPGWQEHIVEPAILGDLRHSGVIELPGDYLPNEFALLRSSLNPKDSAIARYDKLGNAFAMVDESSESAYWLRGRNFSQRAALELLLNDDITVCFLIGCAGTGKTLLALAAALQKTLFDKKYNKILVSRPIVPMGKDIGYLPGDKDDKLKFWMQPISDNLGNLFSIVQALGEDKKTLTEVALELNGILEKEALTYVRGRSIVNQFMIVDEAQNLTPHEIKTIITRAGVGTKIVFTGDLEQIDNPYLDSQSNGLIVTAKKMMVSTMAGHIVLTKTERSDLAREAVRLL